jgi:hypothetical protein
MEEESLREVDEDSVVEPGRNDVSVVDSEHAPCGDSRSRPEPIARCECRRVDRESGADCGERVAAPNRVIELAADQSPLGGVNEAHRRQDETEDRNEASGTPHRSSRRRSGCERYAAAQVLKGKGDGGTGDTAGAL